jgi:16S rRNA (adenine1518-N6/adenine1519-N6)-dimethyltransferase
MELNQVLKKSLGQHLLKDKNLLGKMVRLSGIAGNDVVLEIGPGHGDLTRVVAPQARCVYAVELDERFRRILEEVEREFSNVKIVFSDILKVRFEDITKDAQIVVMGNIPYNITGEILFKLLAEKAVVRGAYLTMQKEVAERLVSPSHSKAYGGLSVIFQLYATVKLLAVVKPGLFVPPPKVDSAFISIVFKDSPHLDQGLIDFIKICFRHKRKFLRHSLERRYTAEEIGDLYHAMAFPATVRAEEIEPEDFVAMYRFFNQGSALE